MLTFFVVCTFANTFVDSVILFKSQSQKQGENKQGRLDRKKNHSRVFYEGEGLFPSTKWNFSV